MAYEADEIDVLLETVRGAAERLGPNVSKVDARLGEAEKRLVAADTGLDVSVGFRPCPQADAGKRLGFGKVGNARGLYVTGDREAVDSTPWLATYSAMWIGLTDGRRAPLAACSLPTKVGALAVLPDLLREITARAEELLAALPTE